MEVHFVVSPRKGEMVNSNGKTFISKTINMMTRPNFYQLSAMSSSKAHEFY